MNIYLNIPCVRDVFRSYKHVYKDSEIYQGIIYLAMEPHRKKYVCKRCLYETDLKTSIRVHLSRIHQCNVVEGGQDIDIRLLFEELGQIRARRAVYTCNICNQTYSTQPSFSRHQKQCRTKLENDAINLYNNGDTSHIESVIEKTVTRLMNSKATADVHNSNIHTQNNVQGSQINIQLNIHTYEQENLSYLQPSFITHCMKDMTNSGISRLIESIHMNPEHPENKNVRLKSKRLNTMETYDGTNWRVAPTDSVLDSLIQKGCRVFHQHYMANLDTDFKDDMVQNYVQTNIMEISDINRKRKSVLYYKVRKDLFCIFENGRTYAYVEEPDGKHIVEEELTAQNIPMIPQCTS